MSTFDIFSDAPGLLRAESANITIKLDRTSPTTARISWNIPSPAAGCGAESRAYDGMVVTLDTTPTTASKIPTQGSTYESDPIADSNLFAGDRIGTSLVVGSFYNDTTTTFVDITGLKAGIPYYVTGFPVDAQLRYFIEGVHAYSQDVTNRGTNDTNGTQVVVFNPNSSTMGIAATDLTGLDPLQTYDFSIQVGIVPRPQGRVDSVDCAPTAPKYTITIPGSTTNTYEHLCDEINHQLSIVNGVQQSPVAPNTGTYYWNASTKKLYVWTGTTNAELPVIVQSTPPTTVNTNDYWLNPTTNTLKQYDGTVWVTPVVLVNTTNPAAPIVGSLWFDGSICYQWNGTTWCPIQLTIATSDPSVPPSPVAGSFWYNPVKEELSRWDSVTSMWILSDAIQFHESPSALSTGAVWVNEVTNKVYVFNDPTPGWNLQLNSMVIENSPTMPAPDQYWYNPTSQVLNKRNTANTAWVVVDALVFPNDPTIRSFCDVWWNNATGTLYVWNGIASLWAEVLSFYDQSTDPTQQIQHNVGDGWYNPTTKVLSIWNGYCFVNTEYVAYPTDPTTSIASGVIWATPDWSHAYNRVGSSWVAITMTVSATDPRVLPTSTMWFDTSISALNTWNGIAWINLLYSTTPLQPTRGALWYDLTNHVLKTWSGETWIVGTPAATCEIDCNGNYLFTDNSVGSTSYIQLTDGTLFSALTTPSSFHDPKPGTDGASDTPSYMEVGIGTDGTNESRRQMQNEIRYELGYPVIDVELTPEQLDYVVDKAIGELRQRAGVAYKRGFFFMGISSETQRYFLTNKISSMNKIVDILGVYRCTSAFLSSAHASGVYGQIMMQHLYNMGTFDLLSFHIMAEYTKLMEMLFAARIQFSWNEQQRELFIHHRFPMNERMVCIEATSERTEQDLLTDRYTRPWIRRYCLATSRMILAETRGKFSTLPGASGSVTLNATDLRQAANEEIKTLIEELEYYVVDKPDEYGLGATMVFG